MNEKAKRVAIVGYTTTRKNAPYNDPPEVTEIWGLNDLYEHIPRYDRWFDIHPRKRLDTLVSPRTKRRHIEVLKDMKCPVYMQEVHPEIPNSIEYPLQEMINNFGTYFTNSISYMLALAIFEGFQEIHLYGVDMAYEDEYNYQRPSCEYFLGIAVGRGIKIHVPDENDMLKARFFYGYGEDAETAFRKKLKIVLSDLNEKTQNAAGQEQVARDQKNQYIGAKSGINEMLHTWSTLEKEYGK